MNLKNYQKETFILWTMLFISPLLLILINRHIMPYWGIQPPFLLSNDFLFNSYMNPPQNYRGTTLYPLNFYNEAKLKYYTLNEIGARSPSIDKNKSSILISGDSTAFGLGLDDADSLGFLLSKAEKLKNYNIINFSLPSRSLVHNYRSLQKILEKGIDVKMFINWIYAGDLEEFESIDLVISKEKKEVVSLKDKLKANFPYIYYIMYHVKNSEQINTRVNGFLQSLVTDFNKMKMLRMQNESGEKAKYRKLTPDPNNLKYLIEMKKICEEKKIKLLHVISPAEIDDYVEGRSYSNEVEEVVKEYLPGSSIFLIKDSKALREIPLIEVANENADFGHYSVVASKAIAKDLETRILSGLESK